MLSIDLVSSHARRRGSTECLNLVVWVAFQAPLWEGADEESGSCDRADASTAAGAQGLGAAAAKEKERRVAQPAKPVKVISQEQLDAAAAQREGWISPDGAFRVGFSGQPELRDDPGGGTTYRLRSGSTALLVNVRSQPSGSSAEAVIDQIRNAALGSLNDASLASERPVATGRGIGGREVLINFSGRSTGRPGVMSSRAFVSGGRVHVVMAVAEVAEGNGTSGAFLDSFEILK